MVIGWTRAGLWLAVLLVLWPGIAWGGPAEDVALAKQRFREGREAAAQGDHAKACAKFEVSLRLFRRASTLLNLGRCHDELGQSASALAYWEQGAALLEPGDKRMEVATEALADLRRRAPRVQVTLPPTLPAGAVINLDGTAVGRTVLDQELRLDPGAHTLRLEAPGHHPNEVTVTLMDGAAEQVALDLGAPLPAPPTPIAAPVLPPPQPMPPPPPERTIPTWVWPVGAVGIVVAAVSIPFAVDYANTLSEQEALCGGELDPCRPDPPDSYDPADDNDRKFRDAVLTTVFAATGGLTLTAAVIGAIIGTEASPAEVAVGVTAQGGTLRVEGVF